MNIDPYKTPNTNIDKKRGQKGKYSSYADVPIYRKQWFFWLTYFTVSPIAIVTLILGDIYYEKNGEVVSFGLANRIVAGLIAVILLYNILNGIII